MKVRWTCDTSRWPLVELRVAPGTDPSNIDAESFYEAADAVMARNQRFAAVVDLRLRSPLDAVRRRRYADWLRAAAPTMRRLQIAGASIADTQLMAGVVTAVHWLMPPPYLARTFTDRQRALDWLAQQIAHDGA